MTKDAAVSPQAAKAQARLPRGCQDRDAAELQATRRMLEAIREVYVLKAALLMLP
jgi:hypothetical protein